MSGHPLWASALAVACGASALAQERAPAPPALRWSDVAAAIDRDPRLAASRARVRAAEGAVAAARTPPNPEVDAGAGRARAPQGTATRSEWGLAITFPLGWLARRGPEIDAARSTAAEAAAEAEALRVEVAAELWRLFVRAAYAQSEVEALEATEQQAEALTALVRRRVDAGEGRPVEVARVELELERLRNDVAGARASRDGAAAALGVWLGRTVSRLELPPPPPAVDAAALAGRHPRTRAALARAAAASAEATVARRGRIPAFSVAGYYESELDREAVGARLAVELPLWNWRTGPIERAEAAAAAEARRADAERRTLAAALAEAVASCERARAVAERQRTAILPRAELAARTLERTFQLGETGILDVIDARRVLLGARRDVLTSARDRDVECGALVLASGGELP